MSTGVPSPRRAARPEPHSSDAHTHSSTRAPTPPHPCRGGADLRAAVHCPGGPVRLGSSGREARSGLRAGMGVESHPGASIADPPIASASRARSPADPQPEDPCRAPSRAGGHRNPVRVRRRTPARRIRLFGPGAVGVASRRREPPEDVLRDVACRPARRPTPPAARRHPVLLLGHQSRSPLRGPRPDDRGAPHGPAGPNDRRVLAIPRRGGQAPATPTRSWPAACWTRRTPRGSRPAPPR
jgi:hypothetical protein